MMKKQILFAGFIILVITGTAQTNTFPTPSGNVGINLTASPAYKLDISTALADDGIRITQLSTGSGAAAIHLDNKTTSGHNWGIFSYGYPSSVAGDFGVYDYTAAAFRFHIVGATGNVGIGTTTPNANLDIFGTSNQLRLSYSSSVFSDMQTTSSGNLYVNPTGGRVGIGTNAPNAGFDIRSSISTPLSVSGGAGTSAYEYRIKQSSGTLASWVLNSNKSYGFGEDNTGVGHIWSNVGAPNQIINFKRDFSYTMPQVWIGDQQPQGIHADFIFAVQGKAVVQSLYVTAAGSPNWADYVFANDYKLPNLYDVEKYYKANKHLPEIPTAKEVEEKGIDVGEINTLLLKKIEELTIYMVEQQKKMDEQQKQIDELKAKK